MKSIYFLYVKVGFTSTFPTTWWPFLSLGKGYTFARTKLFLRLKPDPNDTNGADVKTCLTCSSAYELTKFFLTILPISWSRGWYVITSGTPVPCYYLMLIHVTTYYYCWAQHFLLNISCNYFYCWGWLFCSLY